jgi:hypothetical protein
MKQRYKFKTSEEAQEFVKKVSELEDFDPMYYGRGTIVDIEYIKKPSYKLVDDIFNKEDNHTNCFKFKDLMKTINDMNLTDSDNEVRVVFEDVEDAKEYKVIGVSTESKDINERTIVLILEKPNNRSSINQYGDCTGCGVHVSSIDGEDWDYCECPDT